MTLHIELARIDDERMIGSTPPSELQGIDIEASKEAYDAELLASVQQLYPEAELGSNFHVWDEWGNADTDEAREAVSWISWEAERIYGDGEFWIYTHA